MLLLHLFLFVSAANNCIAQPSTEHPVANKSIFFLDGRITLDSLTKYVHKSSGVRFSFNSVKVKGSKEMVFPKGKYSFSEVLQRIRKTTSLYYSVYSGYIIFQDNPPKHRENQVTTKVRTGVKSTPPTKSHSTLQSKVSDDTRRQKEKEYAVAGTPVQKDAVKPGTGPITAVTDLSTDTADKNRSIVNSDNTNPVNKSQPAADTPGNTKTAQASGNASFKNNPGKGSRKEIRLHYGLQWNLHIPVYGFKDYFTGANGDNQFYNLFIPGVWASKTFGSNSNELLLVVMPVQQFFTGKKVAAVYTEPASTLDTTTVQRKTIVIKTSGIYAGLEYNYHLNDTWAVGGGFNLHWQSGALANSQAVRLSDGVFLPDSLFSVKANSPQGQYIKPLFINARLGVSFIMKNIVVGGSIVAPLTSIFALPVAAARPLNGILFLRWSVK